ncbi:hypothetical protein FRC15_007616 [Serendipita sp. 397]|nr:hypothetical protein FRC15_007616 [Serendipita sp. 397]
MDIVMSPNRQYKERLADEVKTLAVADNKKPVIGQTGMNSRKRRQLDLPAYSVPRRYEASTVRRSSLPRFLGDRKLSVVIASHPSVIPPSNIFCTPRLVNGGVPNLASNVSGFVHNRLTPPFIQPQSGPTIGNLVIPCFTTTDVLTNRLIYGLRFPE